MELTSLTPKVGGGGGGVSFYPWVSRNGWVNDCILIDSMDFRSSNTYQEANAIVDALANLGIFYTSFIWWDHPRSKIANLSSKDANNGFPCYRFAWCFYFSEFISSPFKLLRLWVLKVRLTAPLTKCYKYFLSIKFTGAN